MTNINSARIVNGTDAWQLTDTWDSHGPSEYDMSASARCATFGQSANIVYSGGDLNRVNEFDWNAGQPATSLARTSDGICFLTGISGKLASGDDFVQLSASGDHWALWGGGGVTAAHARCVAYAQPELLHPVAGPGGLGGSKVVGFGAKCLSTQNGSSVNGTPSILRDCTQTMDQKWTLGTDGALRGVGGKCLSTTNAYVAANGTQTVMSDCLGQESQKWTFMSDGTIRGFGGKCLSTNGYTSANGTTLILWDCIGQANQKWSSPPNSTGGIIHF